MALWGKKRLIDSFVKYLNEKNISYNNEDGCISFELFFNNLKYSLFPYVNLDETNNEMSVIINLKKIDTVYNLKEINKINEFNLKSKYFVLKFNSSNILYLEYNAIVNNDILEDLFNNLTSSLFDLEEDIERL